MCLCVKKHGMLCWQLSLRHIRSITFSHAKIVNDPCHKLAGLTIVKPDHVEELLAEGHVCLEVVVSRNNQWPQVLELHVPLLVIHMLMFRLIVLSYKIIVLHKSWASHFRLLLLRRWRLFTETALLFTSPGQLRWAFFAQVATRLKARKMSVAFGGSRAASQEYIRLVVHPLLTISVTMKQCTLSKHISLTEPTTLLPRLILRAAFVHKRSACSLVVEADPMNCMLVGLGDLQEPSYKLAFAHLFGRIFFFKLLSIISASHECQRVEYDF